MAGPVLTVRGKRCLWRRIRTGLVAICVLLVGVCQPDAREAPRSGLASWYGEAHRGKLMANGRPFNPDRLTAASWFYPLGTRVRVTLQGTRIKRTSVLVTITDRGPARRLVREGRIIDLGYAAFRRLAHPDLGLVPVRVEPVN